MISKRISCICENFLPIRGTRTQRNRDYYPIIHQSERKQHNPNIDFSQLNLKYPIRNDLQPIIRSIGFSKVPEKLPDLPFAVERTQQSSLPVYVTYKAGRTKVVTELRKCKGDILELMQDLEKVVDGSPIEVRPGKLVIYGNFHLRVKLWLTKLGF